MRLQQVRNQVLDVARPNSRINFADVMKIVEQHRKRDFTNKACSLINKIRLPLKISVGESFILNQITDNFCLKAIL